MSHLTGHVDATLFAGPLRPTGNVGSDIGHQLAMGKNGTRIYITADMARQWITVLTEIAEVNEPSK